MRFGLMAAFCASLLSSPALAAPITIDLTTVVGPNQSLGLQSGSETDLPGGLSILVNSLACNANCSFVRHTYSQFGLGIQGSIHGPNSPREGINFRLFGVTGDYVISSIGLNIEGDPAGRLGLSFAGLTSSAYNPIVYGDTPRRPDGNQNFVFQANLDLSDMYTDELLSAFDRRYNGLGLVLTNDFPRSDAPNQNGYYIRSITLTEASVLLSDPDPDQNIPVPLPAAGWLMVAALGGLAALRRRG